MYSTESFLWKFSKNLTMAKSPQTIKQFFIGKKIFITGGNGFMGKVLIEKLLRSCSGLSNIYLLIRSKKNQTPEQRLEKMLESELFNKLRKENPTALNKIKVINGEISELGLGISKEDKQFLIENINIIYNAAASVRFDNSLKDAVMQNTRSIREVINLASQMKKLIILVHISTTYCNVDKKVVEEVIYPPHVDWKETIRIVETMESHNLEIVTPKYLGPFPNTYTFTKNLAEHVINDLCTEKKIPTVIFRPSIVVGIAEEPIPGWVDNFNGPIGLLVGVAKGIIRTVHADPHITNDYMPVDWCIKTLIAATWEKATQKDTAEREKIKVYNASNNGLKSMTPSELTAIGMKVNELNPIVPLWYPKVHNTNNATVYYLITLFYQLIPAILIDAVLTIAGKKPMLVKIQRKIYIAMTALYYFMNNEWTFVNNKMLDLINNLHPDDQKDFNFEIVDAEDYCRDGLDSMKRYKMKDTTPPHLSRRYLRRMYILSRIFNIFWYGAIFYIIFFKLNVIDFLTHKGNDVYLYFENV